MFPHLHASCTRPTVWKDLEIMEANENKPKVGGFYCIDQLNLLRYRGMKVNGSKEQPSRFLQVQFDQCMADIRYNHRIKLIILTFFVLRTVYSNLQNVDFLVKVSVFYAVY